MFDARIRKSFLIAGLFERYRSTFWGYGQKILTACEDVARDPKLDGIYFTNFSCGPDSFLLTYARDIMGGKPHMALELDEHGSDTGYMTRIEAFFDVLKRPRVTQVLPPAEDRPAVEILAKLNLVLRRRPGERGFVTMTLADFDPRTGELELVNAEHTPCYLLRAAGRVEEIALPGAPLGGLPGAPGTGSVRLAPGEGVVFLSGSGGWPGGARRVVEVCLLSGAPSVSVQPLAVGIAACGDCSVGGLPLRRLSTGDSIAPQGGGSLAD